MSEFNNNQNQNPNNKNKSKVNFPTSAFLIIFLFISNIFFAYKYFTYDIQKEFVKLYNQNQQTYQQITNIKNIIN
jgi:hypothetical protein